MSETSRSLFSNSVWSVAGAAGFAAFQWMLLIALARLGSAEMVGQYTFALAVSAPVFMFAGMRLRFVFVTDAKSRFSIVSYFGFRLSAIVIAIVTVICIAIALHLGKEIILVLAAICCVKSLEAISDLYHAIFQKRERMDLMAVSMIATGVAMVLALVLVVYNGGTLLGACLALILARMLVLAGYEQPSARKLRAGETGICEGPSEFRFKWWGAGASSSRAASIRSLKALFAEAWPLGLVAMIVSLNVNMPRYFVASELGDAGLGYFAALVYIPIAGYAVVGVMAQAAMPRLARYYEGGFIKSFVKLLLKSMGVGLLAGGIGLAFVGNFGEQLISLIYGREYSRFANILLLLMVWGALSYLIVNIVYALTAMRSFRWQVLVYCVETAALFGFCTLLVPTRGLYGAALSLCLAQVLLLVASTLVLVGQLWKKSTRELQG